MLAHQLPHPEDPGGGGEGVGVKPAAGHGCGGVACSLSQIDHQY